MTPIPVPSRDELLAAALPVERVFGDRDAVIQTSGRRWFVANRDRVVFRYATEHAANTHLQAERKALGEGWTRGVPLAARTRP